MFCWRALATIGFPADGLPNRAHEPIIIAFSVGRVARAFDECDTANFITRAFAGRE